MDDQRSASWLEERGPACRQGHAGSRHVDGTCPVGSHCEIREVSSVGAVGVLVTVLFAVGIEVGTCGSEGRRLALADGVDVEAVLARLETVHPHGNLHAAGNLVEC